MIDQDIESKQIALSCVIEQELQLLMRDYQNCDQNCESSHGVVFIRQDILKELLSQSDEPNAEQMIHRLQTATEENGTAVTAELLAVWWKDWASFDQPEKLGWITH